MGLAEHVHDAAQRFLADRNRNRAAGVADVHAALQAFTRTHRNRANDAVTQLLLDFERHVDLVDDSAS